MTHDRDEVKADYMDATIAALGGEWGQLHTGHIVRSMADEIVRLRGERDALRHEMHDRMNKLHRVLGDPYGHLTEEVARLSRILAALREPSEVVMIAVQDAVYDQVGAPCHYREATVIVRAAVAAAEQESQP